METTLSRFESDLAQAGLRPSTRRNYRDAVERFLIYHDRPPEELAEREVREWLLHLLRVEHAKPSYLRVYINGLRAFYSVTVKKPEAMAGILNPCESADPPPLFDSAGLKTILDKLGTTTLRHVVEIAYAGGMTSHEVCRLRTGDIDSEKMLIRLRPDGRTLWDTFVPMDRFTMQLLREHWRKTQPPRPFLFISDISGEPLDGKGVERDLRASVGRAGFSTSQLVPALRYSFLLQRMRQGAGFVEVKHLLRHTSIRALASPPVRFRQKEARS